MINGSLTYGQLHDKLKSYGYHRRSVNIDGRSGQMFERESSDRARILLPKRNDTDVVETQFMNYVLVVLKTHGIIEDQNPLLI